MDRTISIALIVVGTLSLATAAGAAPLALPWVNGGFEAGAVNWTPASTTSIGDADGDGDSEASFSGCGDGSFQLARGIGKGTVPGTSKITFSVETGAVDFYDFRMILADAHDPAPFANNLFGQFDDPTDTLEPNWFDDQVLAWYSWSSPLVGDVTLDPVDAVGINIPGWAQMDETARTAYLSQTLYGTIVMYACVTSGATLDDFGWVL